MPSVKMAAFADGLEATNYSVHGMTGVDKLHAEGIYGKGVKIAVIDTGVDYNHPAVSFRSCVYRCLLIDSSAVVTAQDTRLKEDSILSEMVVSNPTHIERPI